MANSMFGENLNNNTNILTLMPTTAVITNLGAVATQGLCGEIFTNSNTSNYTSLFSSSAVCQRNSTLSNSSMIVIDITSMNSGSYAVNYIVTIADIFWYYNTQDSIFTDTKNRKYDVKITAPITSTLTLANFNFSISPDPTTSSVRWNCNYLANLQWYGTTGMCGANTLSVSIVSTLQAVSNTTLVTAFNTALNDLINNNDSSIAYNGKNNFYSFSVNQSYYSPTYNTTGTFLLTALQNLASQSLSASGETDVYLLASLTNCAGQTLYSSTIPVALITGVAYSGTSTRRAGCSRRRDLSDCSSEEPESALDVKRHLDGTVITLQTTCSQYISNLSWTDSPSSKDVAASALVYVRDLDYFDVTLSGNVVEQCILVPSQVNFGEYDTTWVKITNVYVETNATTGAYISNETMPDQWNGADDYINMECFCDIGASPNTYYRTSVQFSLDSSMTLQCYSGLNIDLQWSYADENGDTETPLSGQTSLNFNHDFTGYDATPFQLILSISYDGILMGKCRQLIAVNTGTSGFYSLRSGGPSNGYIDP